MTWKLWEEVNDTTFHQQTYGPIDRLLTPVSPLPKFMSWGYIQKFRDQ